MQEERGRRRGRNMHVPPLCSGQTTHSGHTLRVHHGRSNPAVASSGLHFAASLKLGVKSSDPLLPTVDAPQAQNQDLRATQYPGLNRLSET